MRPRFYEVHAEVYDMKIDAIGWNFFDQPIILFIKKPYIYYFNYHERKLERCIDYWYLYKQKELGSCEEVKEFRIHVVPYWVKLNELLQEEEANLVKKFRRAGYAVMRAPASGA